MHAFLHDVFDPSRPWGAATLGIIILIGAIVAARFVRKWARRLAIRSQSLIDPTAAGFFGELAQVICFLLALIIYFHLVPPLHRLGQAVLASAGLVSVVLGLAAQNTLGNLIAGFSLLMYRPFAVGDVLTLIAPSGKETATVKEFTLGYTKLMTEDGRWIIVPNSVMSSNVIVRAK